MVAPGPRRVASRRRAWPTILWRYRNSYRLWEGESPDLPLRVNELLAARQRAIRRRDRRQQQALREELGRHGIVLRDRNKRQHWRAVTRD